VRGRKEDARNAFLLSPLGFLPHVRTYARTYVRSYGFVEKFARRSPERASERASLLYNIIRTCATRGDLFPLEIAVACIFHRGSPSID